VGLSDDLKKYLVKTLSESKAATRDDMVESLELEFVLSPNYLTYANVRTTQAVDRLREGEVTHLKFTPVRPKGLVIVQAAEKGEPGAAEFERGDTRRTGTFNMRIGLHGFSLEWPEDRNLKLPLVEEILEMEDGTQQPVLVVSVKRPKTKQRVSRPRKTGDKKVEKTGTATTTTTAAGAQSGGQAVTPPGPQVAEGEKKA
jgi:hypothetical protein